MDPLINEDSHVSSKTDSRTVVTSAAYLLFYRRKTDADHPLGGPKLQQALQEASNDAAVDSEMPQGSRDSSPLSGEGRRLGDSSHNGLSSASQVGHGHRVGAGLGGSALGGSQPTRGLLAATGSQPTSMLGLVANRDDDDMLPDYTESAIEDTVDEGVADVTSGTYPWENTWSFQSLPPKQPANSEEGDLFADNRSSNDSTRVEGGNASPTHSFSSDLGGEGSIHHNPDEIDAAQFSSQAGPIMHHEDFVHGRGARESAPPPDEIPIAAGSGRGISMPMDTNMDDDDADDPPVMELQADPAHDGELKFSPAA